MSSKIGNFEIADTAVAALFDENINDLFSSVGVAGESEQNKKAMQL